MLISVSVKPGSSQQCVIKTDDGFVVYTHAHAHGGQANEAVIELLADHLKLSKSSVTIKSGFAYKQKIIELPDIVL